jgi:hypothetical protein
LIAEEMKVRVEQLRGKMGDVLPSLPQDFANSGTFDMAVEGVLLMLLDYLLPGGFLVAILGRVLGKKLLAPFKDLLANFLKELVNTFLGDMVKKRIIGQIRSSLDALEPELRGQIMDQVRLFGTNLLDAVSKKMEEFIQSQEQAVRAAEEELRRDDASRVASLARLTEAARSAKDVVSATAEESR